MKKLNIKNSLVLLLAAIIWGSSFISQRVGTDYIGPLTFIGVRSLIGAIVLLPVVFFVGKIEKKKNPSYSMGSKKDILISGAVCGLVLALASNLQTFGIVGNDTGKTGFITAFYIVLVPVLGLFIKRSCPPPVWIGVAIALVGLWFLSIDGNSLQINPNDIFTFFCAIIFAVHILVIDHYTPYVNGVLLSCVQFAVCGVVSLLCALLFEQPTLSDLLPAWSSILYSGIFSCGIAYTLQIIGQKDMDPTAASILLSMESCMSVLFGWLILHESLNGRKMLGCGCMFFAVIFVQVMVAIYEKKKQKKA